MKTLVMRSYAKINICLNVTGKREDGYHTLDMIMVPLQLHDTLIISELRRATNNFVTIDDFSNGCIHYNLATAALEKFAAEVGFSNKFRVSIHKVLPMQAGLGGGSSNAGATILGINKYLKLGCSNEKMISVAKGLGADVPFFILNKPMRCTGIGDEMTPVIIKNNYYALIVKPSAGCGTRPIYEISDQMTLQTGDVDKVIEALENGDDDALADSIFNALQEPAFIKVPEIKTIIESLKKDGLKIVQMTGSGSAVFALSTDKNKLKQIAKKYEDKYFVEITRVIK